MSNKTKSNKYALLLLGLPIAILVQLRMYQDAGSCYPKSSNTFLSWVIPEIITGLAFSLTAYYFAHKYLAGKKWVLLAVMVLVVIVAIAAIVLLTVVDANKNGLFHCIV